MIEYQEGDLFQNLDNLYKGVLIPHVCNNLGVFGAGFVIPLSKKFPLAKESYQKSSLELGTTGFVKVQKNIVVANMIAQNGTGGLRPLRYNALAKCLDEVSDYAIFHDMQIFAPMFGSGLAGGNWLFIEELIKDAWLNRQLKVKVFYLPNSIPANWRPPIS